MPFLRSIIQGTCLHLSTGTAILSQHAWLLILNCVSWESKSGLCIRWQALFRLSHPLLLPIATHLYVKFLFVATCLWVCSVSSDWHMLPNVPLARFAMPFPRQRWAWLSFRWVNEPPSSFSCTSHTLPQSSKDRFQLWRADASLFSSLNPWIHSSPPPILLSACRNCSQHLESANCYVCFGVCLCWRVLGFGSFPLGCGLGGMSLWALATSWPSFQDYMDFCKDIFLSLLSRRQALAWAIWKMW